MDPLLYSDFIIYSQILKLNGIENEIKDIIVKFPNLTGDQMISECQLVTVNFLDESLTPLELFVKMMVTNEVYARKIKDMMMFEKESRFFNLLLPDIKAFLKSKPSYDGFLDRILPTCYFASDNLVVFENLALKGYFLLDRKVPHDYHTARLVMKSMAQFHGSTLAYIQHLGAECFEKKYDFITAVSVWSEKAAPINGHWTQFLIDNAIRILMENPTENSVGVLEYFRKYEKTGFLYACELYKRGNECCPCVVNHGDLWNGNVMLQRRDRGSLQNSMIIDMQTIILRTPAMDLQNYLFGTVDPAVIQSSWRKLLQIYYQDLTQVLTILEETVNFTLEDLENDFRAKCPAGFFISMFHAFAFEAFDHREKSVSLTDGEDTSIKMNAALGRLNKLKGKEIAEKIVKIFEIFQNVRAGIKIEDT